MTDEMPPESVFGQAFEQSGKSKGGRGEANENGKGSALPFLDLSEMFFEDNIPYTREEYAEHIAFTTEFARDRKNYTVLFSDRQTFKNLQIRMKRGEWAVISKEKSPSIHFCIRHPRLREAIESFSPIINEQP